MFAGMYFAHNMGLAIWFGTLLVGILLLRSARYCQPAIGINREGSAR